MSKQFHIGDYVSVRTGHNRSTYWYAGEVLAIFKKSVRVRCKMYYCDKIKYETYLLPKEKVEKVGKTYDDVTF